MNKLTLNLAIAAALATSAVAMAAEKAAPAAKAAPAVAAAPAAASFDARFDQALAGVHRSDENKARDKYRHPKETLSFFGIKPGMQVMEITPGGGWYTEVLAPLMKGQGTLTAAVVDPSSLEKESTRDYYTRNNAKFAEKLAAAAEIYGEVKTLPFSMKEPKLGADDTQDLVVTFRNVHNWTGSKADGPMFKAFYAALKPGGVLGVVEHRAKAGATMEESFKSGYLPTDYVVKLATDAGFKLDAQSEVNANPKDTKDYEGGVWTLPPSLGLKEKDREKYLAIGESDRMTLRFVKPKA